MGFEQRGSRFYYYEKRREGRRVVSTYIGGGALAGMAAEMNAENRNEREQQRRQQREIRDEQNQIDQQLAVTEAAIATVTRAALCAAGYHQHKGQWRKKRHGSQS